MCFDSPAVLCVQLDSSGVSDGQKVQGFARVPELVASDHVSVDFHVDFDGRVPVKVELKTSDGSYPLKLSPGPGELVRPVVVSEADFDTKQSALTGLNQHVGSVDISAPALGGIAARVLAKCNVAAVVGPSSTKATPPPPHTSCHLASPTHSLTHSRAPRHTPTVATTKSVKFFGVTRSGGRDVCIMVEVKDAEHASVYVNCGDMLLAGSLLDEVKAAVPL